MFETHAFDNGLRAVVTSLPHTRAVTIQFAVGAGFGYESEATHGLSHFVEHMLFKGTDTRPTFTDITGAIESLGGSINAATDKEMTAYFVKCPSEHFHAALEVVADVIQNSRFDPAEVERERSVIVDEVTMSRDAPDDWAIQSLDGLLWPDHGLGRPLSVNLEVVQGATTAQLRAYADRYYCGRNSVMSVAGSVEPVAALESLRSNFGGLSPGQPAPWVPAPPLTTGQRLVIDERDTLQVHVAVGTQTLNQTDPDRYPLELVNAILGEGMCSRLFAEIRERRALAYDVSSFLSQYRDCGALTIFASVDPNEVQATVEVILEQCELLTMQPPTQWELERAREYVKGALILGMEDSQNVAAWYAREELLEAERMTVEAVIDRLNRVDTEDVVRVAARVFEGDWASLAAVGPVRDHASLVRLLPAVSKSTSHVA